jgi:hypothetical protein
VKPGDQGEPTGDWRLSVPSRFLGFSRPACSTSARRCRPLHPVAEKRHGLIDLDGAGPSGVLNNEHRRLVCVVVPGPDHPQRPLA